ncbi:MAG: redox-regulated ATPase YchF [Chlamydiae bacterium CG10_big_fil_rev_8_21_14_0_10_35_9]|nr:MAG: redox-regulated ATPase YchF [Chlamydiae bacterium CG10_big_fil_rev_8_21_14_0_10_35_9]
MSGLACAIVGLPNVGKSTLFNALTKKGVQSENYPFCTIDPNIGVVPLEDKRLDNLAKFTKSKQIIYAPVSFVDVAGLVKGASKGEGLGNQFLANIRETDAIIQVVRCFEDDDVIHVSGKVDPLEDVEVINLELILADLQTMEKIHDKKVREMKSKKAEDPELQVIKKCIKHLNENMPLRTLEFTEEEEEFFKTRQFLTKKKVLYVANVSESDLPSMDNEYVRRLQEYAKQENSSVVTICAKIEEEIAQLSPEESQEFLQEVGLSESGLQRLTKAAFQLLGLATFITTGEIETRAWTIKKGTNAAEAAGKIHSDIEKGFIRAEVITYQDMLTYQSRAKAKEAGKARSEGRDYIVKDGDVILFYHN